MIEMILTNTPIGYIITIYSMGVYFIYTQTDER